MTRAERLCRLKFAITSQTRDLIVYVYLWSVISPDFFPNRWYQLRMYLRVPTSREAAIRRRESRSEATQRRRIADERWVVASRGEGEVKVVRLGKPDFAGF